MRIADADGGLGEAMTICKVWDADYPWDVRVEKVSRSLGREHEVHLVCRNVKRRPVREQHDRLHIHRLPVMSWAPARLHAALGFPAFFNPVWIRAIGRTVRRQRARVLVVRDLPLALTAVLVGRIARIPVVLDMAENYPAMIQDVWDAGRARLGDRLVRNPRLIGLVERLAVRLVDHILVVVDESRDRLAALGVPAHKMSVVMNTPTLERWHEVPTRASHPPPSPADPLVIAYLGLLEAPRGLRTAIRAMREVRRRIPQARLMVIGSGRDAAGFREDARQAGVSDAVEFLGWLDYAEALRRLQACDIGLVPHHATTSWQTTIPNKLFDYMSLGKPVIVSDARPTKRIVTEEGCGLVFPDRDASALAEAIVALGDPALREACGRRGREAIAARYNWEADERRLLGAIRQVTDETRSRRAEPVGATPAPSSQGRTR
jgi:glycosyltransferase involved in cell wall biosynthesis